ncbi:MAG: hypothetical protein GY863_11390 [bacterium]|nr:hypothetical protein [bacterium]
MDFHLCSKRLLAVFTFFSFLSCVVPVEEVFAQTEVNKSTKHIRFLTVSAGIGELTDFSKKKLGLEDNEIGYPAFESDCFILKLQRDLVGGKFDRNLLFSTFFSRSVRFSEGLTENRNIDENSSTVTHLSFSYRLTRKFIGKMGIRYRAGVIGKALYESRGIEYLSIGRMETKDISLLIGSLVSVESPVVYNTRFEVSMNNYFAVPALNYTMFNIPADSKKYHQKLVETDFRAGVEYEVTHNKWIRFDLIREEYRSLSVSKSISVPRKDSNRIIFLLSYKQPFDF